MKSKIFRLNYTDILKGALIALIGSVINASYQMAEAKAFSWEDLGWATLYAVSAYLVKNLVTNSNDEVLKPEKP